MKTHLITDTFLNSVEFNVFLFFFNDFSGYTSCQSQFNSECAANSRSYSTSRLSNASERKALRLTSLPADVDSNGARQSVPVVEMYCNHVNS